EPRSHGLRAGRELVCAAPRGGVPRGVRILVPVCRYECDVVGLSHNVSPSSTPSPGPRCYATSRAGQDGGAPRLTIELVEGAVAAIAGHRAMVRGVDDGATAATAATTAAPVAPRLPAAGSGGDGADADRLAGAAIRAGPEDALDALRLARPVTLGDGHDLPGARRAVDSHSPRTALKLGVTGHVSSESAGPASRGGCRVRQRLQG